MHYDPSPVSILLLAALLAVCIWKRARGAPRNGAVTYGADYSGPISNGDGGGFDAGGGGDCGGACD